MRCAVAILLLSLLGVHSQINVLMSSPTYDVRRIPNNGPDTIEAGSPSYDDVSNAVYLASAGDTVTVPSGTGTWTNRLTISKAITLQGAGKGQTTIIDNVATTGFMVINSTAGSVNRLTGFTFQDGASSKSGTYGIEINGQSESVILDNLEFDDLDSGYLAQVKWRNATGVMYECDFKTDDYCLYIHHPEWKNVGANGHKSWATTNGFGTSEFVFIEDCRFQGISGEPHITDGDAGGRFVLRYSFITNGIVSWHGNDTGGRNRGFRCAEIYNNTWVDTGPGSTMFQFRSGTALIYSNQITGYSSFSTLNNYRSMQAFTYGGANGQSFYDNNQGTFTNGTHTGSNGATALQDTTQSWTVNEWRGYTVVNTNTGKFASIASNTETNIVPNSVSISASLTFDTGDGYEVRLVYPCIDQVGRGQGDLMSTQTSDPFDVLPKEWPNQISEPMYEWGNTSDGLTTSLSANHSQIQSGRDYFNDTEYTGYTPYTYPHPLRTP